MNEGRQLPPELEDLAEQIGTFIEYWGFKRVHGHIWCHLFLSKRSLDAAEIMERLGISKALVSMSLKELISFGVIEEAEKSERGTRTYRAKEDLVSPVLATIRRRERRMIARIQTAYHLVQGLADKEKSLCDIDSRRVATLGQLIKLVDRNLDRLVKRKWRSLYELLQFKSKFIV